MKMKLEMKIKSRSNGFSYQLLIGVALGPYFYV